MKRQCSDILQPTSPSRKQALKQHDGCVDLRSEPEEAQLPNRKKQNTSVSADITRFFPPVSSSASPSLPHRPSVQQQLAGKTVAKKNASLLSFMNVTTKAASSKRPSASSSSVSAARKSQDMFDSSLFNFVNIVDHCEADKIAGLTSLLNDGSSSIASDLLATGPSTSSSVLRPAETQSILRKEVYEAAGEAAQVNLLRNRSINISSAKWLLDDDAAIVGFIDMAFAQALWRMHLHTFFKGEEPRIFKMTTLQLYQSIRNIWLSHPGAVKTGGIGLLLQQATSIITSTASDVNKRNEIMVLLVSARRFKNENKATRKVQARRGNKTAKVFGVGECSCQTVICEVAGKVYRCGRKFVSEKAVEGHQQRAICI